MPYDTFVVSVRHHRTSASRCPWVPRGVDVFDSYLGSLCGDVLLVTAVDATLGELRLKPYAADSIIVHAQPQERSVGRREVA